jgi:hypothetical protein
MAIATAGKPAPRPRRVSDRWEEGDETAEDFRQRFGFRGVEFGNWVRQAERAGYIEKLACDLDELAQRLGIKPHMIGATGHTRALSLGLGARGRNPHAAGHYEPKTHAINLVRHGLGGPFVHEWGHAIDFTIGNGKFWSQGPEFTDAIEFCPSYFSKLCQMNMPCRPGGRKDGYWTRPEEVFARSFEAMVLLDCKPIAGFIVDRDRLPQGAEAKRLANIVRPVYEKAMKSYTHSLS